MGATASSSSSDSDDTKAPQNPPPPPSSSSRSAVSTGTVLVGSSSNVVVGDTIDVSNSSKSAHVPCSSSSSSSSSSGLLSLTDLDDSGSSTTGSGGSSSCSGGAVEIEVVTPAPTDWTSKERCRYYPPRSDGCTEPRSCRDCLNIDVGDDYSCMVNQYGRCVQKNPATYVKALDFRNQNDSNNGEICEEQKVQFPANAVDYCPFGDKQCKKCKKTVFDDVMDGRINGSLTKYCRGEEGCVCIAVCEAPIWKSTIGQTVCNGTVVNKDYESQHANTYGGSLMDSQDGHGGPPLGNLMMEIVGGVAAAVVLIGAVMYVRKRRRAASDDSSSGSSTGSINNSGTGSTQEGEDGAAGAAGSVPMAVPVAPTLSLFGWQAMRSELIEREQLLLAGVEDFSNVRTGYLQLLDVDASAPPEEEDESSAPVLLVPLAGASAPSFSPRALQEFPTAPSAPPVSPSAPPASPTLLEEQLL